MQHAYSTSSWAGSRPTADRTHRVRRPWCWALASNSGRVCWWADKYPYEAEGTGVLSLDDAIVWANKLIDAAVAAGQR